MFGGLKNSKLKEGMGRRACECRHGGDTNMCQLSGVFLLVLFFNQKKKKIKIEITPTLSMQFWPLTLPGRAIGVLHYSLAARGEGWTTHLTFPGRAEAPLFSSGVA